eukprot:m.157194 g.157194  ORF g.157194 m.157194 type:complete len:131 (+) comp20848_c0_seq1:1-393(+)
MLGPQNQWSLSGSYTAGGWSDVACDNTGTSPFFPYQCLCEREFSAQASGSGSSSSSKMLLVAAVIAGGVAVLLIAAGLVYLHRVRTQRKNRYLTNKVSNYVENPTYMDQNALVLTPDTTTEDWGTTDLVV